MSAADHAAEEKESLWTLVAPPAIWAAHFLASYITAAIWCAKVAGTFGPLSGARVAILAYTAVAVVAVVVLGWGGFRRHARGGVERPHDDDTSMSRHRFLGFATFLLALLSAVAILYAGSTAFFFGDCR